MSEINQPETGHCKCGCGQPTKIANKTRAMIGHIKGQPIPYINGHNRKKAERYRIEDRGYKTPCWTWLLAKSVWGYGLETVNHQQRAAHRRLYEKIHGPVKGDLDHLCRNRDCVNPDHLEPVTRAVNIQRGDLARLTPEEVQAIRKFLDQGLARVDIADAFGVCAGTIGCIARGHTWKNVP
jgi:hypothetical protein